MGEAVYTDRISLEYDATTKKATLIWSHLRADSRFARLRWWHLRFQNSSSWHTALPIGTIRYEIPAQVNAGDTISLWIVGCITEKVCREVERFSVFQTYRQDLVAGAPVNPPTGFSATAGDAQITLSWDDPMDSSITKYQYQLGFGSSSIVDIPDGDDAGTNPGDETSYIVTGLENGSIYTPRLRAVNANGAGPWTFRIYEVGPQAPGTPAPPSGLVALLASPFLMTWDDPQDPSITGYQRWEQSSGTWPDIPAPTQPPPAMRAPRWTGSERSTPRARGRGRCPHVCTW